MNWVDVGRTLREQGIDESETVLLRRRFFFSDQNIDSRDPVQLNLLYVQARDAILDGTHPVTQDKGKSELELIPKSFCYLCVSCLSLQLVNLLAFRCTFSLDRTTRPSTSLVSWSE